MKRTCVLLASAVLLFAGCKASGTDSTFTGTIESGFLTACTDFPYEPFEFGESDDEKGIDIDLVKAIADDLGLSAKFVDTEFDTILDEMTNGNCDLVASSISITDERKQKYLFSDGYFEVNQSLLVRNADQSSLGDLDAFTAKKKVGVQKGTTGADYAKTHLSASQIVEYEAADEITDALDHDQIDGIVQDFPVNSYLAQKTNKFRVVETFTDVAREQYGFAMAQSSVRLRDAVNSSLSEIRKDGRYDQILSTYLGAASK